MYADSVELKPIKKVPLKKWWVGNAVGWNAVMVSLNAVGQLTGVLTVRDMPFRRFLKGSSRYRMSLDTVTCRVRLFYPPRKRPVE
ncbi:hypothetical protein EVAR_15015_1 [Eumeta japonica]|uniref:Uncharacterized protein n=1 Tax=Eumeta variegata TaxID=151549 RepID=A0A4C1X9I7_EUMVA|nr:hypothetical protein EVAR_15015_1 [Eumeta japonica]